MLNKSFNIKKLLKQVKEKSSKVDEFDKILSLSKLFNY